MDCKNGFLKKIKWNEYKAEIAGALTVIALYGIMQFFGITCPIKYITGISCAGCGMTRAWLAFLHGDFIRAFYYHPLFILPPLVVILFLLKTKINKKWYRGIIVAVVILFLAVYLYRMCIGNGDIVVFEPQNGLIAKVLQKIHTYMK